MKKTLIAAASAVFMTISTASAQGRLMPLEECKELAYSNNTEVRNSHIDYLSARMKKEEVFTNWFPVISARAMGFSAIDPLLQIGLSDVLGSSDMANNLKSYLETEAGMYGVNTVYRDMQYGYGAALNLTQPIYAGGRIVNGNRLASLGVKASRLQEQITRRDLGASIEEKYRLAVSLEEKMATLDKAIALSDKLIGELEGAVKEGITNDEQLSDVQLQRQELKSKRVRLKGSIMLAKIDLCNAMGISSAEAIDLVLADSGLSCSEPETYYRDPAEVVSKLDELRLLELGVQQEQLEKKMAAGEALPEVGLGASYGYGKIIGSARTNGTVYATVNIPLTDWKKVSCKIKGQQYQMEKAQNNLDHLRNMLELQMRQLWIEVESRWEDLGVKEESLTLALKREERTKDDFNAGLATSSEYMMKQVESSNCECEYIDARNAYCNAVAAFTSKCHPEGEDQQVHN